MGVQSQGGEKRRRREKWKERERERWRREEGDGERNCQQKLTRERLIIGLVNCLSPFVPCCLFQEVFLALLL